MNGSLLLYPAMVFIVQSLAYKWLHVQECIVKSVFSCYTFEPTSNKRVDRWYSDENEASDGNESEFESEDDIPLSQLKY